LTTLGRVNCDRADCASELYVAELGNFG
jgi:hypothetical protein